MKLELNTLPNNVQIEKCPSCNGSIRFEYMRLMPIIAVSCTNCGVVIGYISEEDPIRAWNTIAITLKSTTET
jgi:hypothetical protein